MIQGEDGVVKRRGPLQAIWATAENYVYFLAPMVLADRAALGLKPLLMDPSDLRGPWECLWHKVIQFNVKFKFDKSSKCHEKLNVINKVVKKPYSNPPALTIYRSTSTSAPCKHALKAAT